MGNSLSHLSDGTLRTKLSALVASDRTTTAHLLAHLAEFDSRRLYAKDGYPSMFVYCIRRLRFSEDVAFKRIRAARASSRFPLLLEAIADGRLHLTAAVLMAPRLKPENVADLIAAGTHKSKAEIEQLLAERFPQPDVATMLRALPAPGVPNSPSEQVPARVVAQGITARPELVGPGVANEACRPLAHRQVVPEPPRLSSQPCRVAPLAPKRFALQVTIGQETHDKLRRLQDLLGHSLPSGDVGQVLDKAFDALLEKLERAKCGAADRPRRCPPKPSPNPRHVPAHVKRKVWKRDGGRCAFVNDAGQRCPERKFLEYDHVVEVARGGRSTVEGIRLLCRAHNQLSAERTFGSQFMRTKREATMSGRDHISSRPPGLR